MARGSRTLLKATLVVMGLFALATPIQMTSAVSNFSLSSASSTNVAGTAYLTHDFSIVPGTAVQPGTSTAIASGSGTSIAFDLGRVPDTRTITDVVRVTNIDSVTHSLDLSMIGTLTGIAGFEYSDGTTSKSIAAGVTEQLRVRTNAGAAGAFTGSFRFQETGDSFMRLDAPATTAQAPTPPTNLAIAAPDGTAHASLTWTASTASGVAGYNVYRATSAGGTYSKVNGATVTGTSYNDTSVTLGGDYWYAVRSVASGVTPTLDGLDSNIANISVLPTPTSVSVPASASNNVNYVTDATKASVTVNVVVPAATAAGDVVSVTATSGANNATGTANAAGGAQTVSVTGLNLTSFSDGAVTLTAKIVRGAFESPTVGGSATKDVVAPSAPTAASIPSTGSSPTNYVNSYTYTAAGVSVTSSAGASDTIEAKLTSGAASATGSVAGGSSPKTVSVNTSSLADTSVGGLTVQARVVDAAGNPSSWYTGTAGTKDTVMPNAPNFSNISYQINWLIVILSEYINGNNGALGASDQVFITDYEFNDTYGWKTANGSGNFGSQSLAITYGSRTLGYDVRDTAWNRNARVCRSYSGAGTGSNVACP